MDYSQLSDQDLLALKAGQYDKLSDEGLLALKGGKTGPPPEERAPGPGMPAWELGVRKITDKMEERPPLRQVGANLARMAPVAAASALGPAGLIPAMAISGGAGALGGAAGAAIEGQPAGEGALKGGAIGATGVPIGRLLGALAGVFQSKSAPPITDEVPLPKLGAAAADVSARGGLAPASAKNAADTVNEWLQRSGGKLPVNAAGPSVEKIREGLPFRKVGGADMYGALRQDVKAGSPAYDKLLQQYRAKHALLDPPSLKEILGTGVLGSGGYFNGVPEAAFLPFILRILNAARYAPPDPAMQTGLSGLGAALSQ